MKKFLLLCLAVALVISVTGCSSKTEYDKLLDEKKELVKTQANLVTEKLALKKTIASREMDVRDLQTKLKTEQATSKALKAELEKIKSKIAAVEVR